MLHWLSHKLSMNKGEVVTWTAACGKTMVGYKCSKCGKVEGIHPIDEVIDRAIARHLKRGTNLNDI